MTTPWLELVREGAPLPFAYSLDATPTPEQLRRLHGCLEIYTLAGNDTPLSVAMTARAVKETPPGLPSIASVCIYPNFLFAARGALYGTDIRVATVAAGFPHGLTTLESAEFEVNACLNDGADEISIAIPRYTAKTSDWTALYGWVNAMRHAAKDATLRVILSTGELRDRNTIYRASITALAAGADTIVSSSTKEETNATIEAAEAILQALSVWQAESGRAAGFIANGDIDTIEDAMTFLVLSEAILGPSAITPQRFRLGATSLLDAIRATLSQAD